ncbi:MAG TPA: CotH kinase family protein, partial [Planctomicrobium sp.]|nr:CotH kinase family protein [Planctomicrobium sp.]
VLPLCLGALVFWGIQIVLSSAERDGVLLAQDRPPFGPPDGRPPFDGAGPRPDQRDFGPGGPEGSRRGGTGGFGRGQDLEIVKQFDKDGDQILNREERQAARAWLAERGSGQGGERGGFGRGPGGPRGPGGEREGRRGPGEFGPGGFGGPPGGGERVAGTPGPKVNPNDVSLFPDEPLYSQKVIRTLFLTFENNDWEEELAAFKNTDVEVPVTLVVDGQTYPDVGVSFRGMSSFMMVPAGSKRSLKLSLDFRHSDQKLLGYKTLNLLNGNGDPSLMNAALYSRLVREKIPAPQVNFVKVVINGESWGIYANGQQFNKDFLKENYGETDGVRWKASGNPGADAGLRYLGENIAEYKQRFEIKSKDKVDSWKVLINLCRVLDQTPPDELEQKLSPILDIDEVLWFLAYDLALVNEDGYWTRASDYNLYLDSKGRFHVIPHDMNETFHASNGPGGPGGPEGRRRAGRGPMGMGGPPPGFDRPEGPRSGDGPPGRGPEGRPFPPDGERSGGGRFGGPPGGMMRPSVDLDPLVAIDSPRMPLHSKLLAVPKFRQQYLAKIREIAEKQLDWKSLGPLVAEYRDLIGEEVKADTRKLSSYEAFVQATADRRSNSGNSRTLPLRTFADQRREFLMKATAPARTR